MNNISLFGIVTFSPMLKTTPKGKSYCVVTLLVDRGYKQKESDKYTIKDFIPIWFWGHNAEYIARFVKKHDLLWVTGELQSTSFISGKDRQRYCKLYVLAKRYGQGGIRPAYLQERAKELVAEREEKKRLKEEQLAEEKAKKEHAEQLEKKREQRKHDVHDPVVDWEEFNW